jgi:uncharacterized protein
MNVNNINDALVHGALDRPGLFPHLELLERAAIVFDVDFGLPVLPEDPGVILIRGARQYGKSTWLEGQLRRSVQEHGPASAFYLNGDEIARSDDLLAAIRALTPAFAATAGTRRLFIDEITAVQGWEKALKRAIDAGDLRDVLVVTTGSRATDLRRGTERLPGRRGRLDRSTYLFTPVSFSEFSRRCGEALGADTLVAYLLSGGSPVACRELATAGCLPPYVPEMMRDWILGEVAASGRSRASLVAVMEALHARGGSPLGQARLAREAGLANNTVAAGYVELLADLMCVGVSPAWDEGRKITVARRPAKFPLLNLLAAVAWAPPSPRSVGEFEALPAASQGRWWEWLVAQEIWRRAAIRGDDMPERIPYWKSRAHELDFVLPPDHFVEVKRGRASPLEYAWFPRTHPGARLTVINRDRFETDQIVGVTMEDFLAGRVLLA